MTTKKLALIHKIPDWLRRTGVFARKSGGGLLGSYDKDTNKNVFEDPKSMEPVRIEDAQVIASRTLNGTFRVVLDLDIPHYYQVSSSGNGHLVIDVELSKNEHDELMDHLASLGIIQEGFARSAKIKEVGACVRLPWTIKGFDQSLNERYPEDEAAS